LGEFSTKHLWKPRRAKGGWGHFVKKLFLLFYAATRVVSITFSLTYSMKPGQLQTKANQIKAGTFC